MFVRSVSLVLNVCLTLNDSWRRRVHAWNAALKPFGDGVDHDKHVPHVTLYLSTFPLDSIDAVTEVVERLARRATRLSLPVHDFSMQGRGYVFLDVERTGAVDALHGRLLRALR
ncbi:MAG: 2'-5' RNA ligase family protein, partial [Polyangiales bacterium]